MKTTAYFLDALRAKHSLPSDGKLALKMGWKRQQISRYRQLRETFSDATSIKVAEALGVDPGYVMACMHAQLAKTPEVRSIWERVALKAAACLVAGIGLAGAPGPGHAAFNNNQMGADLTENTHMRTRRRKSTAGTTSRTASALSALARYAGILPPDSAF